MSEGLVVYESIYGNMRAIAEGLGDGLEGRGQARPRGRGLASKLSAR